MKVRDVMVRDVATVSPSTAVREVARLMVERRISGLPVVDADGRLLGIVSEGDLLHRAEAGTERRRSWWLDIVAGAEELAQDYVRSHARAVGDVMTRRVHSVTEDADLADAADLMDRRKVKRVPVVKDGRLVGILSRADLVRAFLLTAEAQPVAKADDAAIRQRLDEVIAEEPWIGTSLLNVAVTAGEVELGGFVASTEQRRALQIAAEAVPGVSAVRNNVVVRQVTYGY